MGNGNDRKEGHDMIDATSSPLYRDLEEILLDHETIRARVAAMGKELTGLYAGSDLVCVCILKPSIQNLEL